ncbi:MAG: putative ABC transporter ATP-binding protein [Marinobacterium sp. xm-d-530]|nr:MAG: putative ABC transporter ATP-binding protein [Marinobacterium sp. xm-d-530]
MILSFDQVIHRYSGSSEAIELPSFTLSPGEKILVIGPSGSGKSTLLNLVTGVQPLQQGDITLLEHSYANLSARQLDCIRADHMGVIFQALNLIPYLNGFDNAQLGVQFSNKSREQANKSRQEISRIGHRLGLSDEILQKPAQHLSIGQQQRVAVIRALLGKPELIIADEPTSALDEYSTDRFMTELMESLDSSKQAVLMVSHNPRLTSFFDQVVELKS